jgi:hypothetical protein
MADVRNYGVGVILAPPSFGFRNYVWQQIFKSLQIFLSFFFVWGMWNNKMTAALNLYLASCSKMINNVTI